MEGNNTKYGLFQIDDQKYCSTNDMINEICDVLCAHLNDDELYNDLECLQQIYKREGFSYWPSERYCASVEKNYLDSCFITSLSTTHRPFNVLDFFEESTTSHENISYYTSVL
jgi:hypothetical protein